MYDAWRVKRWQGRDGREEMAAGRAVKPMTIQYMEKHVIGLLDASILKYVLAKSDCDL